MTAQTIQHSTYGSGVVVGQRFSGFELKVRFSDGRERFIRTDQIQVEASTTSANTETSARQPHYQARVLIAQRSILEMLRLGIVPENQVHSFTFGRDTEIDQLRGWLDDPAKGSRVILGGYGTGKTHLLNYLRNIALKEGYAVAFTEMDAQEAPFSRPKRVYSQLVQNLRYRNAATGYEKGFRDLLRQAMHAGLTHAHPYFCHLANHIGDDNVWEWIEGREDAPRPYDPDGRYRRLPRLYNHGTAANIYTNLLSGLGSFCQSPELGLKGLLLIFDESETLFGRQTRDSRQKSFNFLDALVAVANNDPLLSEPETSAEYITSAHAWDIPLLYRPSSGLKLALAFSDALAFSRALGSGDAPQLAGVEHLHLNLLDDDALFSVFEKISTYYQHAYGFRSHDLSTEEIFNWALDYTDHFDSIRMKIKGFVEILDLIRHNPGHPLDEVLA